MSTVVAVCMCVCMGERLFEKAAVSSPHATLQPTPL